MGKRDEIKEKERKKVALYKETHTQREREIRKLGKVKKIVKVRRKLLKEESGREKDK